MSEQLNVTDNVLNSLNATRPWVKFLAILGFIFSGLVVLLGLFLMFATSIASSTSGMPHFFGPVFGLFYILLAIFFYIIPCVFLYRYGSALTRIPVIGQSALEEALRYQKSFWKYMGIFAIVVLVLYVLFIIIGIGAAFFLAAAHHAS